MPKEPYQGQVTYNPGEVVRAAQYAVEGNDTSAYVGVDPVYQNYANDTERPIQATEPVETEPESVKEADDEETEVKTQTPPRPSLP